MLSKLKVLPKAIFLVSAAAGIWFYCQSLSIPTDPSRQHPLSNQEAAPTPPTNNLMYDHRVVGFPEFRDLNCQNALSSQPGDNVRYSGVVGRIPSFEYSIASDDCFSFRRKYGFERYPEATTEERNFPLAFIILFHKDLDQVMFLLRAIYRKHNVYCLTVDQGSGPAFVAAVRNSARCLTNVFVSSQLETVVYEGFSRLMADMHCLRDLAAHPVDWKYALNLPGQQFPLRTNQEMVQILRLFHGANDIEGMTGGRLLPKRFKMKHKLSLDNKTGKVKVVETWKKNPPAPHNIRVIKGSAYGIFSKAFVRFVLEDRVALDLLEWSKDTRSPDEYFWASLHHTDVVKVPGGYTGSPDEKPWFGVYTSWVNSDPCATIRVREICIFSPEDLPLLLSRPELFANKFYISHHPVALHCLDQFLYNLTVTRVVRDLEPYKNLKFALTKPVDDI